VLRFLSRRLLEALLALLFTSILVFSMIHMIPGDPALLVAGLEAGPEVVERIRRDLGLEGVISILEGMNPRMIETKLCSFLAEMPAQLKELENNEEKAA